MIWLDFSVYVCFAVKASGEGGLKWCMHHFKSERGKFVVVHPPILPVRAAQNLAAALSRCMHHSTSPPW